MSVMLCALVFPFLVIYAAVSDVMTMTIGNRLCVLLSVAFFPVAVISGLDVATVGVHATTGFAMLLVGIALFAGGFVGGGDAKLFAATALWLGPALMPSFLLYCALYGVPLTFAILYGRAMVPPVTGYAFADRLLTPKAGVPYGVALSAAALTVYLQSPVFVRSLAGL